MSGIVKQVELRGGPASQEVPGNIVLSRKWLPQATVPSAAGDGTARKVPIHIGPAGHFRIGSDFELAAGGTLPAPLATQDTSAAGSPTLDYSNDAAAGHFVLKLATTNEAEAISLYFGDQTIVDPTKKPVLQMRLKVESDVTGAGGAFAAGDKLVFGLASDRNATLDNITRNAWFMFAGANHNIYIEGDDGTTDTDDTDTGIDWAENTFTDFAIDFTELANVKFFVNGVHAGAVNLAAISGNMQFFIELTKAAAANKDHRLTIDFYEIVALR